MLNHLRQHTNRWLMQTVGHDWVDYIASNTMTVLNRRLNDFIWTYELKAQVIAITEEADQVKTMTLMPNQRWQGMQAGQYIQLKVLIDGVAYQRAYSLSPLENGCFTITVKQHAGGRVSTWLHEQLTVGMELRLEAAQGQFCYQQQEKILFISAGSGITPCYSIIQSLLADTRAKVDIALYAQFSQTKDVIYRQSLQQWRAQGVQVHVALSQQTGSDHLLTADNLLQLYPDFRQRDIYLCGPAGFMDNIITLLQMYGYDMTRLHCERFNFAAPNLGEQFDFSQCQPIVDFKHLHQRISLSPEDQGQTLLALAHKYGVLVESGCERGMCGSCKLTLKEGKVSGNQLGKAVYLCTSYPDSAHVVLDA
ncbi:flavin reductase family protein [Agitococcus lubricus]|uniref:Ferredoxin-NADP reductase n=1 Tax=Agitococcus lubricus TaxID=1077255 RepID=A0A2T5IZ60_9GAMM|nr:iron-sulfur cluster-binding domain-containing protein [Agitococcus lubricus]PTQ89221.1 ferredoxin-NADP reductase [Agitococcus lubricus]